MPTAFTVVLTGGIGSGKTAVSSHFASLGVPVIDTDLIARELVEPGQPALARIAEAFGPGFLAADGRLDRARMRRAIFSDPALKRRLESILHPLIGAEVLRRVNAQTSPYCILVIPLYAESAAYAWVDRVLVVDVSEQTQIARVMKRDGIDRAEAVSILRSQADRQGRVSLADDVLDNSGDMARLREQVEKLHHEYLEMAKSH